MTGIFKVVKEAALFRVRAKVSHLILHVTNICNFRCQHCFVEFAKQPIDLTLAEIDQVAEVYNDLIWLDIGGGGGEPFIRDDLDKAARPSTLNIVCRRSIKSGLLKMRFSKSSIEDLKDELDSFNNLGGGLDQQVAKVNIANASASEDDGVVMITVTISETEPSPVSVSFFTQDGTAVAGEDYVAQQGTLIFAAGETSKQIAITLIADGEFESDEIFRVILVAPIGVRILHGTAEVKIINDDSAPLLEASKAPSKKSNISIKVNDLTATIQEAKIRLASAYNLDQAALSILDQVNFVISDLNGLALGQTFGTTIFIDKNAAGWGWFVDDDPEDDSEFSESADGSLLASSTSDAYGKIDLLTVVMHELSHVLGILDSTGGTNDLMETILDASERRLP